MDDYANDASTTALLDLSFADSFGIIDYSGDQDWLRMELAGGTSYEIHVHGQDFGYDLAAPRIRIYDSSNNLIASADATDGSALLEFTALSYGTHYISIDSSDPDGMGSYNFHGFGDDNSGSQRLTLNSEARGALEYFGDEDSFQASLVAGTTYTFDLRGQATGGGTLADPLLELRAPSGAVIASDVGSGAGTDARILFTPVTSGSYTLAARESGGDGLGSYTIAASAPTLGLAVAAVDADRIEGNAGNQPFSFSITRTDDLTATINVAWAVTGSGANPANAADFANGVLPGGSIAFAAGESSRTLTVNVRGDTQIEPDEGFLVTVSSPANGAASASGAIRNDDGVAVLSIAATTGSSGSEGSSGETPFAFTVSRTGNLSAANAVTWAVTGSGASPGSAADFTDGVLPSGTVSFAAAESSKTINVGVHGDTQLEPTEGFLVTLSGPTNGAVLGTATASGSIQNDDVAASISIATTVTSSLAEGSSGETPFAFTVTRTGDLSAANAVAWAVTGSGASPANAADFSDGALPSGTVTFAAGESSKTITVGVHGDTQLEPTEGFLVTLSGPTDSAVLGTATASGSIQNDDSAASISIAATASSSGPEGSSGETPFAFTVSRTGDLSAANAVAWAVTGSGASPANAADFTDGMLPSGTVSFAADESSKTIVVGVHGDTQLEPAEGFLVTLSGPTDSAVLGTATASGSIQNDDSAASISVAATASATGSEGSSGETAFAFTMSRTGDLSAANAVAWAVTGSGASPASAADFTAGVLPSGTVTFATGESSKTIAVGVHGDTVVEPNEGFLVTLSGPTNGAVLGTATASGLIQNDDVATSISIATTITSSLAEGSTGETPFAFTVTRTGDLTTAHAAAWAVTGTGASPANAADFTGGLLPSGTVSFAAGESSKTITVSVHGDTTVEPNEGFLVTLAGPTNGAVLGTATASGLIQNDDLSLNAVNGTAGADTLTGTLGADRLQGLGGNDVLIGRAGNDVLDGGTGTDRADWLNDGGTLGVNADLMRGTTTRGPEVDTLLNLEDLRGTQFADTLQGNDSVNTLDGNAGNDTLSGRGGNDLLAGGTGSNTMDGGTGTDRVTYSGGSTGIVLDMGTGLVTRGTDTDRIVNIENATGSASADTMRGNAGTNLLQGLAGNDALFGQDGNDTLVGGAGKDSMTGGAGRDVFDFAAGESGTGTNADIISGFDGPGATAGDTIDLRDVFSGTLVFRGVSTFSGLNQVRLVNVGTDTVVQINLSGNTTAEMEVHIVDVTTQPSAYTAADFLL